MNDDEMAKVLSRKLSFLEQRRRSFGPEYYENKDFWDRMWEQEWVNLEEIKNIDNLEEMQVIPIYHPLIEIDGEDLTIYTYSDFTMLHNQGIFRDEKFVLDHAGKWKKNVIKELGSYGYDYLKPYKRNMLIMVIQ
jgi:hypothetical protein